MEKKNGFVVEKNRFIVKKCIFATYRCKIKVDYSLIFSHKYVICIVNNGFYRWESNV